MRLIQDWRKVVKKAWSIRLSLLAALFGGIEVLLSLTDLGLPQGIFVCLSVLFSIATPIARLVAQSDLYKPELTLPKDQEFVNQQQ